MIDPLALEEQLSAIPSVRTAVVIRASDESSVEYWIESDLNDQMSERIRHVSDQFPKWARPSRIAFFHISDSQRQSLLTRKGEIRRQAMIEFLRRQKS